MKKAINISWKDDKEANLKIMFIPHLMYLVP